MRSAYVCSAFSAAGTVLDLVLKNSIEALPDSAFPRTVPGTGEKVNLQKVHNSGFPMGTLSSRPELVRGFPLFVLTLLSGRYYLLSWKKGRLAEKIGLAAVIGGGFSNVFDRCFRGFVVDYINVKAGPLEKIVFNLGDAMIGTGGFLIAGSELLRTAGQAFRKTEETGGDLG